MNLRIQNKLSNGTISAKTALLVPFYGLNGTKRGVTLSIFRVLYTVVSSTITLHLTLALFRALLMAQYYGNVHFLAVCRIANTGGVVMAHLSYNTETDLNGEFGF